MNKIYRYIILIIALTCVSSFAFSQCNEFTKKDCIPLLSPYTFNGQLNNTVLSEGETAELQLTFYADQEYRILVAGEDQLGQIRFQLLDVEYNILYDNKDENFTKVWDFSVESTDDFIVRVMVDQNMNPEDTESGCVSMLIGFRAFGSRTLFK